MLYIATVLMVLGKVTGNVDLDSFVDTAKLKRATDFISLVQRQAIPIIYSPLHRFGINIWDYRKMTSRTIL